ncbi:short chain dehydrogenase [Hirsutella rhossiliensis]|uniref:Short-chain dehydrogenase/reductase 3 n=1 Tax=Hirsutella rhossiliensis TaxID=111463 RepID=A0A9P8SHS3_9HYPO|nr:short chain dehydrogenase domain-containing protein [Hirsutella rhossiliensis]KAH0963438.1 short chain dehydrogenase domain-containing protein [Hirsutella rhossiliensis]
MAKTIQFGHTQDDKKASQFCGTCASTLWSIKCHLQKPHQARDESQKKVEGLLNNLERLCSYPLPRDKATGCLRNFASADNGATLDSQLELVKKFRRFSGKSVKEETAQALAEPPSECSSSPRHLKGQQMGFEMDDDIQHLHSTLLRYQKCRREGSHRSIITNIRLNGYRRLAANDATAEFGVLFFDHPHTGECHWQEACIQICPRQPSTASRIRFWDDEHEQQPSSPSQCHENYTPISYSNFCHYISSRSQAQLLLSAQNGMLMLRRHCDISRNWISNQRAVPLATLLREHEARFTEKMKAVLAMLLARAAWQFYDSALIGQGLTKENVHFLFEERDRIHGVFINEPMLVTRFKDDSTSEMDLGSEVQGEAVRTAAIHDRPKLLALGLLLLELETGTPMETYREDPDLRPAGPLNVNTDHKIAKKLLDPKHPAYILREISPFSPFRKVLPMCIEAGELTRRLHENLSAQKKTNPSLDPSKALIYSEIVLPFEQWVTNYDDPDMVKVLYKIQRPSVPGIIGPTPQVPSRPEPHTVINRNIVQDNEYTTRRLSQRWFENYDQLKEVLQPQDGETGAKYQRVKIAVLDTGIDPGDYWFYRDSRIIDQYKDFVDSDHKGVPNDETGHGSAAVSLLVKTCPNAGLYLARVLKTNSPTRAEVDNVVNAIDWAIGHKVDIITMALGFREHQPDIADAITKARGQQILIFSVASNARNMDRIYFPARIHDQVFGIFSTNGGNRESRDLNPSPDDRQHSFAIFGEGVELTENAPLVRGTSYSTSIAAGLAAMLLDFSRQETSQVEAFDLSRLREMKVMTRVLLEMARESSDGKYKCIRPWDVLRSRLDPCHVAMTGVQRKSQRVHAVTRSSAAGMLPHTRLLPREGFCGDVVIRVLGLTVFNPVLLLPLALVARFTDKGHGLSDLHPWASTTLTVLLSLSLIVRADAWLSDKARNNWIDDAYDWSKEIVLVTGGAQGIGGSMVRFLDDKGIMVVVLDLQPMSFTTSSRVHHFHCDIRSPERVKAVADAVRAKVGHPTVVINNAGVVRGKTVLDAEPTDVRFTFDVNTLSHFWVTKAFLPNMTARNHGMVVTVSSIAAWAAAPGMVDYSASKAAAKVFSEGLAAELSAIYGAPNVRTVSVHPGYTKTALFQGFKQRSRFLVPPLEPDSVAEAVVKQVLTGRSAQVILPRCTAALRILPEWFGVPFRARTLKSVMAGFRGRQVVNDVDAPYEGKYNSRKGARGEE